VKKQRELEVTVAVWGAVTFGALLASYSVFRPVRDAVILDGDPDKIPWLFTATFLAMMVVSPLWSASLARWGRRHLVPLAFHAFALCAIGFSVLVATGVEPVVVGRVFYVWASVFNLFVISVFWSLLSDLMGPELARRLYGPIAAGGTVGSIAGPALTRVLVGFVGVEGVLVGSAILLELAVLGVRQVRIAGELLEREEHREAPDKPAGGTAFDGIVQVARSPYLAALVGYVLCTAIAATFMYLEQAKITRSSFADRDLRTAFFATIDLWAAIVALLLQTVVAAKLLERFGPGIVLLVLPISQVFGISVMAFAPSVTWLVIAQVASRAATHGLTRPSRELLFTVIDRDAKYRAKNLIDTVGYRFGDLAGSWVYSGLLTGADALVAVTIPLVAIWVVLATILGIGFRRRTKESP
jgi:AAA family ATP:ADP antiporter